MTLTDIRVENGELTAATGTDSRLQGYVLRYDRNWNALKLGVYRPAKDVLGNRLAKAFITVATRPLPPRPVNVKPIDHVRNEMNNWVGSVSRR